MSDGVRGSARRDRRYRLLVNPSAGSGRARRRLPAVEAALAAAGAEYELVVTESIEHGIGAAREAVERGMVPVVMSGDGLIGKVGGLLAGGDVPLGVIPGGRGNDFARVLGIPTDPAAAVSVLLADDTRRVDVGEADGVRFLCIASCGFDSDANRIANDAKWVRGPLVYAYAAIRALAQWKSATFTLTADGERRTFSGYSVAVANSKAYGGGMFIAPRAELDDGLLDIVTSAEVSKLRFLRALPQIFKGTHLDNPQVDCFRAREVTIEADRPFVVFADGDPITELPATVRVLPAALRVIAPAEHEAAT
jgi:YegS/Rv2252/BmrU family lipid kinase